MPPVEKLCAHYGESTLSASVIGRDTVAMTLGMRKVTNFDVSALMKYRTQCTSVYGKRPFSAGNGTATATKGVVYAGCWETA